MIRAVIFDFNGILADDDPIHMQALRKVAEEEGLTVTQEDYVRHYLPLSDRDCFHEIWRRNRRELSPDKLNDLIGRKSAYYFSSIEGKNVLFEGASQAVDAALGRGPVAIASGARIGEIRHILGSAGLLDCFSTIVSAEDVQNGKPDPEPFLLAFERLRRGGADLLPSECVVVEDSLGGIHAALAAGMPCLGVAHSYSRGTLEEERPQWVIDSIAGFKEWLNTV